MIWMAVQTVDAPTVVEKREKKPDSEIIRYSREFLLELLDVRP